MSAGTPCRPSTHAQPSAGTSQCPVSPVPCLKYHRDDATECKPSSKCWDDMQGESLTAQLMGRQGAGASMLASRYLGHAGLEPGPAPAHVLFLAFFRLRLGLGSRLHACALLTIMLKQMLPLCRYGECLAAAALGNNSNYTKELRQQEHHIDSRPSTHHAKEASTRAHPLPLQASLPRSYLLLQLSQLPCWILSAILWYVCCRR